MTIRLLHLFPGELSASGDSGNVQAVSYRLTQRGFDVDIIEWNGSGEFPQNIDAVFIGNGPWSAARIVLDKLRPRAIRLVELRDAGVPIFAVGIGAEILSREVIDGEGNAHQGLGVFSFTAAREVDRRVGYMKVVSTGDEFVGFGDFASIWTLDETAQSLGEGLVGDRSHELFAEGVSVHNCVATRLGGPALPLNPVLADRIVASILKNVGKSVDLGPLTTDEYPENARRVIFKHLDTHFSTIAL